MAGAEGPSWKGPVGREGLPAQAAGAGGAFGGLPTPRRRPGGEGDAGLQAPGCGRRALVGSSVPGESGPETRAMS